MESLLVLFGLAGIVFVAYRERARIAATPAGQPRDKPTSIWRVSLRACPRAWVCSPARFDSRSRAACSS